jgi:methylase of polypeptide subunit release factors
MKTLLKIINGLALLVILFWVYNAPDWDSVVTLVIFTGTFYGLFVKSESVEELEKKLNIKLNNQSLLVITKLLKKIDAKVLRKTRNLNTEKIRYTELNDQYIAFINRFSKRNRLKIEYTLESFNKALFNPNISKEIEFTVEVENELKKITLQNHKEYKVLVDNPKLMWECSCNGNIKRNREHCPIHKNFQTYKEADQFSKDFREGLVKIKYDDIEIFWKDEKDLWPPSIDTFNLVLDLKKLGYDKKPFKSVIDIGSGTGFLGIWLAKNNKNIRDLYFSDWLLLPLFFSYTNAKYNIPNLKTHYLLGLNTSWPLINYPQKTDLIICNPPYLPELGFKELTKESTVAGTQLLKSILQNGLDISKEVIISFSDLVLPEAKLAAEANGIDIEKCKIGETHLVPFRVPIALRRKGYINKLLNERALIENPESEFKYWHKVNTYSLKRLPTKNIVHLADSSKNEDDSNKFT